MYHFLLETFNMQDVTFVQNYSYSILYSIYTITADHYWVFSQLYINIIVTGFYGRKHVNVHLLVL